MIIKAIKFRKDGNIISKTSIIVSPDEPVEIRRLELKNTGLNDETLEITSYFEPVLSRPMQDYSLLSRREQLIIVIHIFLTLLGIYLSHKLPNRHTVIHILIMRAVFWIA